MTSHKQYLLLFFAIIVVSIIIAVGLFEGLKTDPTPPTIRTGWYLPHNTIVWAIAEPGMNQSLTERFVLSGEYDGPAQQFPPISPYARYENYTREKTGDRYMIAVWYFTKESAFLSSKKKLNAYLTTSGTVTRVSLNYSGFVSTDQYNLTPIGPSAIPLPEHLVTTGYESSNTSGLFYTIEIPGTREQNGGVQTSTGNEYYIVYYGIEEPYALSPQLDLIRDLIGHTFTFDRIHSAGPLLM